MKNVFRFDKSLFSVTTSKGTLTFVSLLIPILLESILGRFIGTVNTVVLSGYSDTAVAAVGAANEIISLLTMVFSVVATGATVIISEMIGAEKIRRSEEAAYTSLMVCTGIAVLLLPILLFGAPAFMHMLNLEGEMFDQAVDYFRIRSLFLPVVAATSSLGSILRCNGYPKYTVIMGFVTNIINLLLNVYVVYLPQYSPVTGASGVAWASAVSQVVSLGLMMMVSCKVQIRLRKPATVKILGYYVGRALKIGVPSGISSMCLSFALTVTTSFIAQAGDYALSAKFYFSNILCYAYMFSNSAGAANALLVGRLYGAGKYDHANTLNKQLVRLTRLVNFSVSLVLFLFRDTFVGSFTDDARIFALATGVFLVDIVTEQARATSQVYENALRATGDVFFMLCVNLTNCALLSVGLAWVLTIPCHMGLLGFYVAVCIDEWLRAIFSYTRWRSGKWHLHYAKK